MSYSNFEIARALDLAVDLLENRDHRAARRRFWTQFTCIHVDRLELDGVISSELRAAVQDEITDSIWNHGTFNGYYKEIMNLDPELRVDDHIMVPARIKHMRELANTIRNR